MPIRLAKRLGLDTVAKLDAAARHRFEEAECLLKNGYPTGAVYLFGYVAEAHIQAACLRTLGYRLHTEVTA